MLQNIYMHPDWGTLQQDKEHGLAECFDFQNENGRIAYPFIRRFAGKVGHEGYWDLVTPRGEAGPRIIEMQTPELISGFDTAFDQYCRQRNIVAEYIRFDPWNDCHACFQNVYEMKEHGWTYCHPLQEDFFNTQYNAKRRNLIRKAIKSGVTIRWSNTREDLQIFLNLYQFTIDKHHVSDYYLLDLVFLRKYFDLLGTRVHLGFAYLGGIPVAAAFFLNGGDVFHYHFSASHPDYLACNAISLLVYEGARKSARLGCTLMDLGGATPGSGLELFKRSMTRTPDGYPCHVGTKIRQTAIYDQLIQLNGRASEGYFPQYRRPL